jgi:transposase
MGKPYSDDLCERVVAAIETGHTREEVAELFNLALSPVGGFIKRKRETGSVSPGKFGGYIEEKNHAARLHSCLSVGGVSVTTIVTPYASHGAMPAVRRGRL